MQYAANRGGHAPGHLREAFGEWLEGDREIDTDARRLIGQLWNCTDIMPRAMREIVDEGYGIEAWTYAQAVRAVRAAAPWASLRPVHAALEYQGQDAPERASRP